MEEDEKLLCEIGLTKYESSIYHKLLHKGSTSASDLSKMSSVPMGKIYEVINSLKTKGFLEIQRGRPMKYYPIKPRIAFEGLIESKRKENQRTLENLKKTISKIESHKIGEQKQKQKIFWTTAIGKQEAIESFDSYFASAEKEIIIISGKKSHNPNQKEIKSISKEMKRVISKTISRGVKIKIILPESKIYKKTIESEILKNTKKSKNLQIKKLESEEEFTLIDEKTTILKVQNPVIKNQLLATIKIIDKKMNKQLRSNFNKYWKKAKLI